MTEAWKRVKGRLMRMSKDQKGTQTPPKAIAVIESTSTPNHIEIPSAGNALKPAESTSNPTQIISAETSEITPGESTSDNMPLGNDQDPMNMDGQLGVAAGANAPETNANRNKRGIQINEFESDLEADSEREEGEIDKDEEQTKKFLMAMADASATDRYIKRVSYCDGSRPEKTLSWLRAIDQLPPDSQVFIAIQTAEASLKTSVRELQHAKWPKIKTLLAKRYVNANFAEAQKEALDRLEQRPGESLYNYVNTFEILLNEAYRALPEDQTTLIRTFLSGLSDREMAKRVAKKKLETLPAVVKEVRQQYQDDDLLRPRRANKVHFAESVEDPQIAALSSVVSELAKSQKETSAQIAALVTAGNNPPKPKGNCFRCGKGGHFARECRTNNVGISPGQVKKNAPSPQNPLLGKCNRCRRSGHIARDCRSGPPRTPCYCGGNHWLYDCPTQNQVIPKSGNGIPS